MSKNRFDYLLQQYSSGQISEEEKKEFLLFIQLMDDENLEKKFSSFWEGYEARHILSEIRSKKMLDTVQGRMRKIRLRSAYLRAISAAAVIAVLLLGGFWAKQTFFSPGQPIQIYAQRVAPEQVIGYDRTLTLADGSRVVLKAGSKLEVSSTFNRTKRIVRLVGEAYFDIAHDKSRPFVIETGDVKTTVLGTAFNIKAWPGDHQVNVAVARGKVRVDDGGKLLAVLTVSQGIEYHTLDSRLLKQERVQEVETASKWVASDLHFDHQSFLDIARTLSRRYGVDIQIENQQIANMKLVSSFSGTESLSDILDILCGVTQNISYSMEGNRVLVSLSDKRS